MPNTDLTVENLIRRNPAVLEDREGFLQQMDVDLSDYESLTYDLTQYKKVTRALSYASTGSSAVVPLMCGGAARCPFAATCTFVSIGKVPIGKPCLTELYLFREWARRYLLEYNVSPTNWTEVGIALELAEIDIYLRRAKSNLAKVDNADLTQINTVGIDRDGNIISKVEMSVHMEIVERLSAKKAKLVKMMVGDPQEKYKRKAALKMKEGDDLSTTGADLRRDIERISKELSQARKALMVKESIPAESIVITPDDLMGVEPSASSPA